MNEFSAKKLGEVLAFARVGSDTFDRGADALRQALSEEKFETIVTSFASQAFKIEEMIDGTDFHDAVMQKAEKTGNKLTAMRDMYIGEEWDNAAELYEWLGFFEGSAAVHWNLVAGAADALQLEKLADLASEAISFHEHLLETIKANIRKVGREKAVA